MDIGFLFQNYEYLFYFIFFIIALVEGPIISFTLGYFSNIYSFNIFLIYFIVFLGDFVGDILHYFIGRYFNKVKFINKRISHFDLKLNKSLILNLLFLKVTPPLTSAGLFYMGYKKVPFRKFILSGFSLSILFSFSFTSLGRFSGISVNLFKLFYSDYLYFAFSFILFAILVFLIYKYYHKFAKIFENFIRKK